MVHSLSVKVVHSPGEIKGDPKTDSPTSAKVRIVQNTMAELRKKQKIADGLRSQPELRCRRIGTHRNLKQGLFKDESICNKTDDSIFGPEYPDSNKTEP